MAKQKQRIDGRISRSFTVNGKRHFIYGRSKQELDRKEYEKRQKLEAGQERRDDPTFAQYYQAWTDTRRDSIKPSTLHSQAGQYNAVAGLEMPDTGGRTFSQLKLSEVTTDDIRAVQRALLAAGRKTQTVNDTITHIKHVFETAVKERRLDYNPCTLVQPLKRTEERARDTHHRALTKDETRAFFEAAASSWYYDVYRIALYTGMRIGEIGALYTTDIRNDLITVEKTITRLEDGRYEVGSSAKTEAGRRTIPVNDSIREIIEHQKTMNRALFGNVEALRELIFKAPEGGLLMSTPVNREIKRICKAAGVEPFTMHALRATFATRAIEQGINPRTIQEILGHSDYAITMNLYGHVLDETKRDAMLHFEAM